MPKCKFCRKVIASYKSKDQDWKTCILAWKINIHMLPKLIRLSYVYHVISSLREIHIIFFNFLNLIPFIGGLACRIACFKIYTSFSFSLVLNTDLIK